MRKPSSSPRSERIAAHYERLLASRRAHHEILDWASAESQHVRFDVLLREVDLSGRSLLDVGAGLGDLYAEIKRRGVDVTYTGVDLLEKMADAARQRHPDGRFVVGDVFSDDVFEPDSFDVVFCSGTLNLNLGNNMEFLPRALRRFVELAREVAVVNLLRPFGLYLDPTYFAYEPEDVQRILREIGCPYRLVTGYLPNDFTVVCEAGPS